MKTRSILLTIATSVLSFLASTTQANVPLRALKTFDGQIMRCDHLADTGRPAYRIKSTTGLIRNGNLEVTIEFETLKCVEQLGQLGFEKAGLEGRLINPMNGFVEFSSLELVSYTPDFKFVRAQSANLTTGDQRVVFTAPVSDFVGLLRRNTSAEGRQVVMLAFLRGHAKLGDARTGKILEQSLIPFGAYNIFLSEQANTLAFAR